MIPAMRLLELVVNLVVELNFLSFDDSCRLCAGSGPLPS
jgi:hypothetical protein